MTALRRIGIPVLALTALLFSCGKPGEGLFTVLDAQRTGLAFENRLTPTPEFNLFSYMYYYNGSGLGAGDFNNDGLTDLFFASNQRGSALYLNRGDLRFEDVTPRTGIPLDSAWNTGVSVADVNADGMLDIYLCRVGRHKSLQARNILLVCKGIEADGTPRYAEEAAAYGLDFSGFSTHATFLDHDGDGDLDMFLLNHSVNHDGNYAPRERFIGTYDSLAGQRLYLNESEAREDGSVSTRFRDITREAGINGSRIGYGLGVAVSDVNLDGWPDIYVGNDFHENDYLYMNRGDGTFREEASRRLMHTSQFSMGVDVADLDNDAFPEIVSMDMLPYDPVLLRRSLSEDDYDIYRQKIAYGYAHQYARNNLQYNRGDGRFSEVGQYAGIHATDWSWASLLMDFDNDGRRDLFVSNGIPKRMNDIDYISFVSGEEMQEKLRTNRLAEKDLALTDRFPEIKIPNRFLHNRGGLRFEDIGDSVPRNPNSFSNGAVYADLDNDGDLDIVVNNINDPALLYRNNTNGAGRHVPFAGFRLRGPARNPSAIGARVILYAGRQTYVHEHTAVHGFQSSMDIPILIGLGSMRPDSAVLVWPDGTHQPVNPVADTIQTVAHRPGLPPFDFPSLRSRVGKGPQGGFSDVTAATGLLHRHEENPFNEFDREPLLPQMMSTEGPALAVADIDHDGLEDVFVGSSKTYHGAVYLQKPGGRFSRLPQPAMAADSMWENVSAVWADIDGDGHKDLVAASGGNEYYGTDPHLLPLAYLNNGKGYLKRKSDAFTGIESTQGRILAEDFDGDGDTDLFLSGRAQPWAYGRIPRSHLLYNDGSGRFHDSTAAVCPDLQWPGMVTDAQCADIDGDGVSDLLLCYQWGGIESFLRRGRRFEKRTLHPVRGWWQRLLAADLDGDGDTDILAGNFGLNSRLKASEGRPVRLYVHDFDGNGRTEQVMTYHVGGREIPFASKVLLEKSLPVIRKRFLYAADFARADLRDLLGSGPLSEATVLSATGFESVVLLNEGGGRFRPLPLPMEAQLSSIRAAALVRADGDSLPDIMVWGNFHANNVEIGRQDALFGALLLNRGGGRFIAGSLSGLGITGQVNEVGPIGIGGRRAYVLARNDDSLRVIMRNPPSIKTSDGRGR